MKNTHDWLRRLLQMIPVRGTLDHQCSLGAPWPIDFAASEFGEIPDHVIRGGSAVLEDPEGGPTLKLIAGDILLFPHGSASATRQPHHQPIERVEQRHDGFEAPLAADVSYRTPRHSPAISAPMTRLLNPLRASSRAAF
jgi:Cupin